MISIEIVTMAEYCKVVQRVSTWGHVSRPRGMETREVLGARVVLQDPTSNFPSGTGRGLIRAIAHIEAVQLVGGFSNPDMLTAVAPRFRDFMDNGAFWGAYGNRIGSQVVDVVRKLQADPDTRQAVITLWDPELDNSAGKHDYPCTVMFQFMLRSAPAKMHDDRPKLWMFTTMRSNDVWLGFPYDVFQFTMLQTTIANALNVDVGLYVHNANSLHLYMSDDAQPSDLRDGRITRTYDGFGRPGMDIEEIIERAHTIGTTGECKDMTSTEQHIAASVRRFL